MKKFLFFLFTICFAIVAQAASLPTVAEYKPIKKEVVEKKIFKQAPEIEYNCITPGFYVCGVCFEVTLCGTWAEIWNGQQALNWILSLAECEP